MHLSELLQTSRRTNVTSDHTHQWLDENGWEHRKTYIQDVKGNIYEATLNIARGKERNILYDINNVRQIDKNRRVAHGAVPSTGNGRGSLIKSNSSDGIVAKDPSDVNRQYSISESKVDKAGVISDLRAILQKGGDPAALRQYIADLERNAGNAEQNPISAERNTLNAYQNPETAQEILAAAREMEVSVEEYLEMNWERYDVDGQWNDAARQALQMEESGSRQYSISANNPLDSNGAGGVNLTSRNTKEGDTSYDEGRIQTNDARSSRNTDETSRVSDVRVGDRVVGGTGSTSKTWGNLSRRSRDIFRRKVESIINNSSNYDEIRFYLASSIGKQVQDMSLADKNAAIDLLAEQLYFDLVDSDNYVIAENKWGFLGSLHSLQEMVKQIQSTQKSKRQYSVSQSTAGEDLTEEQTTENGVPESAETTETINRQDAVADGNVRETLPRKAERYLKRAERTLLNKLSQNLSVPWFARRNFLQPMVVYYGFNEVFDAFSYGHIGNATDRFAYGKCGGEGNRLHFRRWRKLMCRAVKPSRPTVHRTVAIWIIRFPISYRYQ